MAEDEILIDDPELERELELASEEIERGECVDGDEVVRKLRSGEYAPAARRQQAR